MHKLILFLFLSFGLISQAAFAYRSCGPDTQDFKKQLRCTKLNSEESEVIYLKLTTSGTVVLGLGPLFKTFLPSKSYVPSQVERQTARPFVSADGDTISVQDILFYSPHGTTGKIELKTCDATWVGICTEED
jgi:hypothetical protein